jgi:hypothetical protein
MKKHGAPTQDRRQERFKKALLKLHPDLEADLASEGDDEDVKKEDDFASLHGPSAVPRQTSIPHQGYNHDTYSYRADSPDRPPSQQDEDEETGRVLLPGEPAIPVGHTTGAARLLLWPAVEKFLGSKIRTLDVYKAKSLEAFVEYPNLREQNHGIRLYGRGPGSTRGNSADGSPDDAYSDVSASPTPEVYGQIGGLTPPPNYPGHYIVRRPEERRGGAGPDGQLELDEATVNRLVQSYLKHIHIMHPILDPIKLVKYSKKFVKTLPPDPNSQQKARPQLMDPPGFVGRASDMPAAKRKRSPTTAVDSFDVTAPNVLKPGRPQRSIQNAILLWVLALGKICEHREKIPELLPDHDSSGNSPNARSGFPSPMMASPVVSTISTSLPSPREAERLRHPDRRASTESFLPPRTHLHSRNLDVIPGLAYAAFASDITGNEIAENKLENVHANILASLYFGQLARPSYSHRYINNASLGIQIILRL